MTSARHRWLVVPLLLGALGLWAAPAAAQHSRLAEAVRTTTLDNGLQVIVAEDHAVPLATVLVAVRNGAFTQEPRDEGLAHLYEHLLFRTYDGDPQAFWMDVGELGAYANGTTSAEVVDYFIQVPSKRTKAAMRVLARLVRNAKFTEADLKAERPIVLDELQRNQSHPEGKLMRAVERALWGNTWSRKDIGGDSTSLAGITLERVRDTWGRFYVPNNAALIITGDVDAAEIFREAAKQFSGWRRAADPFLNGDGPPMEPLKGRRAIVMGGDTEDVTIVLAWQGPSARRHTRDTYPADALFGIFNAPTSAFQRRLVNSGLFRSLGGGYETLDYVGPITIRGQTSPERAQEALTVLLDEVDRLDELEGVSDEDLALDRISREVTDALVFEQGAGLAPSLANWWSSAGMGYYAGYPAKLNEQTRDDLARFARTYITGKPMVIGILASPAMAGQISGWLRGTASGGKAQ
jgi:zinc protease